jgi:hypothetical protein
MNRKLLFVFDEVNSFAGEWHNVNNALKCKTTATTIPIEEKGKEISEVSFYGNFVITTNGDNPAFISKDNRRFVVFKVCDSKANDTEFFGNLRKEVSEGIELLRGYFKTRHISEKYRNPQTARPTTQAELDLVRQNMNSTQMYIEEQLLIELENESFITEERAFREYKEFSRDNGLKAYDIRYFRTEINKDKRVARIRTNTKKDRVKTNFYKIILLNLNVSM